MCEIVFSLDYYGIKMTTKTYKSQGKQLSPTKTADVTLKTQNEIGGCFEYVLSKRSNSDMHAFT